ncbi:MAG: hypothetical protein ACLP1D_13425 [Xanthobacteraceae bacterium]
MRVISNRVRSVPMLDLKPADRNDQDVVMIAPAMEAPSILARDTMRPSLDTGPDFFAERTVPPIDATFRAAAEDAHQVDGQTAIPGPGERPWLGSLMRRSVTALLVMFLGVAATLAWHAQGHQAKEIAARWAPTFAPASWLPRSVAEPSSQPPVPTAEATVQAPQPEAQPAPSPRQAAPEIAAPAASEVRLQAMARDLATLQQAVDELKGSQEQLARNLAKLSEQEARRKPPAASPRPASTSARKPAPALPSPQAALQSHPASPSPAVAQAPVQPQSSSAPRPPVPLP